MVEHRTVTPLTQVRFPDTARDFSPRVNFQCRLSYMHPYIPCAIACINICAHVKDPVVHVRVRWIMETLKHPAYTGGWVRDSVAAGFSQGKQPEFSMGEIPLGQYSCKSKSKKVKVYQGEKGRQKDRETGRGLPRERESTAEQILHKQLYLQKVNSEGRRSFPSGITTTKVESLSVQ